MKKTAKVHIKMNCSYAKDIDSIGDLLSVNYIVVTKSGENFCHIFCNTKNQVKVMKVLREIFKEVGVCDDSTKVVAIFSVFGTAASVVSSIKVALSQ